MYNMQKPGKDSSVRFEIVLVHVMLLNTGYYELRTRTGVCVRAKGVANYPPTHHCLLSGWSGRVSHWRQFACKLDREQNNWLTQNSSYFHTGQCTVSIQRAHTRPHPLYHPRWHGTSSPHYHTYMRTECVCSEISLKILHTPMSSNLIY